MLLSAVAWLLVVLLRDHCSAQSCPSLAVCSCPSSSRVVCNGGGLTEIPDLPANMSELVTEFRLANNRITTVRTADLQGFTSLTVLDLSANQIRTIENGSFLSNTDLEELDLSENMLTALPDNIFNSTLLFTLDLSHNNIADFSPLTFTGVQEGAVINLDGNAIESPNEAAFSNLPRLHQLTLTDNPIRCDCELRWFPAFTSSALTSMNMLGSCNTPLELSGVSLGGLMEDQLLCNCTPTCVNGVCNMTVGECVCDSPGYTGAGCDTPCPAGSFGEDCAQSCSCPAKRESSPCDHVNGTCNCLPAYTGSSCETEIALVPETTAMEDGTEAVTSVKQPTELERRRIQAYVIAIPLVVAVMLIVILVVVVFTLAFLITGATCGKRRVRKKVAPLPQKMTTV